MIRHISRRASLLAATCLLGHAAAFPAFAQEAGETSDDVIVVTGQKIERSLQETPVSVGVTTAIELEEKNILDLKDAIDRTANVVSTDGTGFTIRGIDSVNVSGAGVGDLATVYVDGSPLPREAAFAGPGELWDVEQVEIFRGPQSTLQGRASLAGAIIINTADPTYDWTGRARAMYTTKEDEYRFGAALGGPLIEDQLAFRVAVEHSESDGFGFNPTRDEPSDARNNLIARGKLLIEPANLPDLSVLLSYTRDERALGFTFNSLMPNDPERARLSFNDFPIAYDTNTDLFTATVDYDLTDAVTLTSITGYNEVDYSYLYDTDQGATPGAELTFDQTTKTWTQELRAQYDGDRLDGVVGFYYSNIQTPPNFNDGQRSLNLDGDLGLGLILFGQLVNDFGIPPEVAQGLASDVVALYPNPAFINTTSTFEREVETYAAFADFSYDLTDRLTLYGGARYDVEQQFNANESLVNIASTLPDPAAFPAPLDQLVAGVNGFLFLEAANASSDRVAFDSPEFGGFLPKIGLGYDIDDERSLSFTVQRGYRSGGAAVNTAQSRLYSFDQEFIWNYEGAFRSRWLDGDLTLNANLFYIDWSDQQVAVQLSNNVFDTETRNAGSSHVYGFEVDTLYRATPDLDLYGSIGYSKTEFDEFIVVVNGENIDFAGNEFAFAPRWTVNAGATWTPGTNWLVNVNANHASAGYIRADREQTDRESEARTLVNFRAGYDTENWGLFITGQNILNDEYVITQFPNDPLLAQPPEFAQFGDPRTFSIQLETRF